MNLAKELLMGVVMVLYALVRGRARLCGTPKRVLVWQMAKLGDMVCTTPMLRALKESYPEIHVVVVGNAISKRVLEGNTDVDEYIVFNGFLSMVATVRQGNYDAGFITAPSVIALATLFLGKVHCIAAPRIVNGYSPYETNAYRALLPLFSVHPHRMGSYAPREYLRLLESVGIHAEDTSKHLAYSDTARQTIDTFLRERGIGNTFMIGLSPSAGNKIKRWPAERFAEVAKILHDTYGATILVLGGARDREEVAEMAHELDALHCPYVNTGELFSLDELKALIAHLKLFIAVDTGPIYIAEAFGVPTVDIVGPIDEQEQPPIGPRHAVVIPRERVKPELRVMNARMYSEEEAKRQTLSITVEDVVRECRGVIDTV